MFENNDKSLLSVRIIVNAVVAILFVLIIAIGVGLIVIGADKDESLIFVGIVVILLGALLSWLLWVFARLMLSFMCDVKLIRNKLYENSNDNLKVFTEATRQAVYERDYDTQNRVDKAHTTAPTDNMKLLRDLKTLYDSGAIDAQEYNREKERLLKR